MFTFKCHTCDQMHSGMPTLGSDYPLYYLAIPQDQREERCDLSTDTCVIDNDCYFVRGCLEIHVHDENVPFILGVWTSLSEKNFKRFIDLFETQERSNEPPMFGWLSASIKIYPETENLKTLVHLRDNGIRPYIEIEPTDHPLALEQRNGISRQRLAEIYESMLHE